MCIGVFHLSTRGFNFFVKKEPTKSFKDLHLPNSELLLDSTSQGNVGNSTKSVMRRGFEYHNAAVITATFFVFFCTCSLAIARLSLWLAQSSQTVALFSSLGSSSFALAQEAPIYRISQLFSTGHTARHGVMTAVAVVCFRTNSFLYQ